MNSELWFRAQKHFGFAQNELIGATLPYDVEDEMGNFGRLGVRHHRGGCLHQADC